MWPVAIAALNGLVRNEPRVAPAADAVRARAPARDIRLVLIRHAERQPVQRGTGGWREVEDELVAIVEIAIAVNRLVVTDREIASEPGGGAGRRLIDRDGFDPVNDVLEAQVRPGGLGN